MFSRKQNIFGKLSNSNSGKNEKKENHLKRKPIKEIYL